MTKFWRATMTAAILVMAAGYGSALRAASVSAGHSPGPQSDWPLQPRPLVQNWTTDEIRQWYDGTQGSRLIPYSWLAALEQPDGTEPFLSPANVAKYRYLPREGQLPVGFAVDNSDDSALSITNLRWMAGQGPREPWVGFTCSACHTGEITYNGAAYRIEGGPSRADFQGFLEALDSAVAKTQRDKAKFQRFATKVLAASEDAANRATLETALDRWLAWERNLQELNCENLHGFRCRDIRYGYGRLDAFGHIYNKVEALVASPDYASANPANAPVRYPQLWNVPQESLTQWNAHVAKLPTLTLAAPFDVGALTRNVGEVIGVFGDVTPVAHPTASGFQSSLNVDSLVAFELMLGRLQPPAWPTAFGAPDPAAVAKGEKLYQAHCVSCHAVLKPGDLSTPINVTPRPIPRREQTDELMACNAALDTAQSGMLKGTKEFVIAGQDLKPTVASADLLATMVMGVIFGKKGEIVSDAVRSWIGFAPKPTVVSPPLYGSGRHAGSAALRQLRLCHRERTKIVYKARPLDGVWAAGPYLHNGSVPTLYDLLSPPSKRPREFWVGTREFDPTCVGFVTTPSGDNDFKFSTYIPGNSNKGHDYGASKLTEDERQALLAYLKTL